MAPEQQVYSIVDPISDTGLSDAPFSLEAEDETLPSKKAMNATAYRIFKLLQWLIQSPKSVDALNDCFRKDPGIRKPVSSDSIWLYINTLKALGCKIRRPSPKNGFQYEMLSHPFGLSLSDVHLETLSQAKAFAQQQFTHQEMMTLDCLLKKIVAYSSCEEPDKTIEQLFLQSRSFDYEGSHHHIEQFEQWIEEGQLLRLCYLSPLKGAQTFPFLPTGLFYEQGVVYVRGERPDFGGPSNLRIDRVHSSELLSDTKLLNTLSIRRQARMEVTLHLVAENESEFQGFGLTENQDVYDESWRRVETDTSTYFEVKLQVRDFFYLKQRLLACGLPFRILHPIHFREEMATTLEAILRFYQGPQEAAHG